MISVAAAKVTQVPKSLKYVSRCTADGSGSNPSPSVSLSDQVYSKSPLGPLSGMDVFPLYLSLSSRGPGTLRHETAQERQGCQDDANQNAGGQLIPGQQLTKVGCNPAITRTCGLSCYAAQILRLLFQFCAPHSDVLVLTQLAAGQHNTLPTRVACATTLRGYGVAHCSPASHPETPVVFLCID